MTERLVVLDKNRKGILTLPPAALKLWLLYWMNEDEERESYLSHTEIRGQGGSGVSQPTITTWTKYLVRHGWLIDTGKTAYDKLLARGIMPSANSKQVHVYRVDDPTPKASLDAPPREFVGYTPKNILDKVSCSGSDSGFASGSGGASDLTLHLNQVNEKIAPQDQKLEPEPKTVESKPTPTKAAGKRIPVPEGFDSWSLEDRLEWSRVNRGTGSSTMQPKPKPKTAASDDSRVCIECNNTPCRNTTSDYCEDCWLERQIASAKSFEL